MVSTESIHMSFPPRLMCSFFFFDTADSLWKYFSKFGKVKQADVKFVSALKL